MRLRVRDAGDRFSGGEGWGVTREAGFELFQNLILVDYFSNGLIRIHRALFESI